MDRNDFNMCDDPGCEICFDIELILAEANRKVDDEDEQP